MLGYSNDYERMNKSKIQEELFDYYVGNTYKSAIMFPSTTMNDLKLCFEKGLFTKETKFLFVEKGECYPYRRDKNGNKESFSGFGLKPLDDKNMRKVFFINELLEFEKEEPQFKVDNCYFHFDELYTMDLKFVVSKMQIDGFDFCYFDFCGGLPDTLISWFRYNASYFCNSELMFTHCIDNLTRGNRKTWGKFDKIKPLEYYGMQGETKNIVENSYKIMFQNLTDLDSDSHIHNANNMLLFYEKLFNKKFCDLVFYKDMEGLNWNHKQKMCSFRLIKKDVSNEVGNISWINEIECVPTIFDNTEVFWKNNFYKLSSYISKKTIDKYTYIELKQFKKLKQILNRYVEMYDVSLFRESKKKIKFDRKNLLEEKVVQDNLLKNINKGIVKIVDFDKKKEFEKLFIKKMKELENLEKEINKTLMFQMDKKKKKVLEYLKSISEEERKALIESVNCESNF